VDVAVDGPDVGPEDALERDGRRVDDGHVEAALARGCGHLGADPARAYHHDRAAAIDPLAQDI
jgi:hypothetical protein